jgi:outer membrane protein TolC
MIDERRTALQQAEVFQKMTENERIILLNDLLYDASSAYLNWQNAYYSKEIIIENIDLANIYLANTKLAFDNGEKTQMDTLEARIALQEANNQLIATEIIITASRQNAENYLWLDNLPLEILPSTAPERFTADFLLIDTSTDIDDLIDAHPIIQSKINKLSFYELEQRWKREKLKPKLSINFNPLLATTTTIAPTYASSDYKWSVDFSMPLLFRSEKAEVTRGNIKIQNVALDIDNKRLELKNKIENTLFQQSLLKDQINLLEDNIRGYRLLLDGENDKFLLGESSVFLVNKRQEKYIMSRLKLLELTLKLQKESLSYLYYSNQLINPYLN